MFIIRYKSFFIGLSVLLIAVSIGLMFHFGIKKGIDFSGGTVVEITYDNEVPKLDLTSFEANKIKVFQLSDKSFRMISSEPYEKVLPIAGSLAGQNGKYKFTVTSINTVGPSLGAEMTKKALIALAVVVLCILLFIAFAFRGVSYPVSSWKYGIMAMATLIHDIIVPTGVYVILSHLYGAEVDTLFVIALLTIIAISISDKIVVFDRIRENLKNTKNSNFEEVVGKSLSQTFTRSVNTSVTVILALLSLYFFGPTTTKYFALTLMIGMIVGTYSSIFVASPLLTVWEKFSRK